MEELKIIRYLLDEIEAEQEYNIYALMVSGRVMTMQVLTEQC